MHFSSLGLSDALLEGVAAQGWTEMTPIQEQALPVLLKGRDVVAQAETGSGKTGAFALALLHRLGPVQEGPQALVLCPTRELADQVAGAIRALAVRVDNTRVIVLVGGRPMRPQVQALEAGCHVVVGTPGRVARHLERGNLRLDSVDLVVLDEADRMLDMGFIDEVEGIVRQAPAGQTALFSATFAPGLDGLIERVLREPMRVGRGQLATTLRQRVYLVPPSERNETMARLLAEVRPERSLVFCETRRDCDAVARFLAGRGAQALALHGQLEQRERDDVLLQFRNRSASVLVATNLAARGLDIEAMPVVLIAELSDELASHVHRIGRTGRAGEEGLALTLVCGAREEERLRRLEDLHGPIERGAPPTAPGGLHSLTAPFRTLLLLGGRQAGLRKGDVLGALVKDLGLSADSIGRIDLAETVCAVAVDRAEAGLLRRDSLRVKKQKVRLRLLD